MNTRAARAISIRAKALFGIYLLVALGGCSSLPGAAPASVVYDFGPGVVQPVPTNRMASLPTLALGEVLATAALDHLSVQYRLGYSDAQQLRPYSQARWSMPPAQLLRQRVRETLGARRSVVNQADGLVLPPHTLALRLELEEFSQLFSQPGSSDGVVRLRATLSQASVKGDVLVAQRSVLVRHPAASADAAGGVRALTVAVDDALQEIDAWVQQVQQAQAAAR
jgi:cholesterol transport system auxiliary component